MADSLDIKKIKSLLSAYGQEEYLSLSELSFKLKISEDYLIKLITGGRLKGFKMGADWLTTAKWFRLWLNQVKGELDGHLSGQPAPAKWINSWQKKKPISREAKANWLLAFQTAAVCLFVIYYSFFLYQPSAVRLADWVSQKEILADNFLILTNEIYRQPAELLAPLVDFSHRQIDDEILTVKLKQIFSYLADNLNEQVAGAQQSR